jgi:hypothetical protein
MREQRKSAEFDEAQGFELARVGWFSYNPVDFNLLRGCPAGIAVASLTASRSYAQIQEAGK